MNFLAGIRKEFVFCLWETLGGWAFDSLPVEDFGDSFV